MFDLNFSPMCNILVYLTLYELYVKKPSHPANMLVVYLSPKQVVLLDSVRLFVVF